MEIWKDTFGLESLYECSDMGMIRNKAHKRILKGANTKGYINVRLCNGRTYLLHRLIALTFIPNPENKRTVNHKKGIKNDNRVSELEWATDKENNQHSYRELGRRSGTFGKTGSLSHSSKKVLCLNDNKEFDSATLAASHYKIQVSSVTTVCTGVQKKTRKGLLFKYL